MSGLRQLAPCESCDVWVYRADMPDAPWQHETPSPSCAFPAPKSLSLPEMTAAYLDRASRRMMRWTGRHTFVARSAGSIIPAEGELLVTLNEDGTVDIAFRAERSPVWGPPLRAEARP